MLVNGGFMFLSALLSYIYKDGITGDLIRMAWEPAVKELVKIGEPVLKEQSPEIWENNFNIPNNLLAIP